MKKLKILLIVVALSILGSSLVSAGVHEGLVSTIPGKHKNLFVLKAGKKFMGAKVEVLYSNGEMVTTQIITKRKMIIDFCDVKQGSYTIRVSNGEDVREFRYDKYVHSPIVRN